MVDRTRYLDKLTTPDLALRQIFGRQKVPSSTCLLFASAGLLTVDTVATMGDSHASVRSSFTILAGGEEQLGSDPRARENGSRPSGRCLEKQLCSEGLF